MIDEMMLGLERLVDVLSMILIHMYLFRQLHRYCIIPGIYCRSRKVR